MGSELFIQKKPPYTATNVSAELQKESGPSSFGGGLLWLVKEAGIKCNFKQQVTTYFCMQFKGDYVILNFNSFRTDLTYRKESNKNKNKVKYEVTDYVVDVMIKFISLWL